jgi:cytochrome c6
VLIIACNNTEKEKNQGKSVYQQYCKLCHGDDGKLGLNGSKDLSKSILNIDERIIIIKAGRNTMTPYRGILSEEEIKAVANYTMTLK